MIGNVKLKGCAPMLGGWYTDMWNAIKKGVLSSTEIAAQLLNLYRAGQLTPEEYTKLQIELAKAQGRGTSSDNTKTILIVGGVALAALALGIIGNSKK